MIDPIGPLDTFWFVSLSLFGLIIGFRMGAETVDTIFGMEEATAQVTAHAAMVMAMAINVETVHAFWQLLVSVLPQPGTDLNQLTAVAILMVITLFWVFLPIAVCVVRNELAELRNKTARI